jgi:hypothetical protein
MEFDGDSEVWDFVLPNVRSDDRDGYREDQEEGEEREKGRHRF